ncbi:hypothetical protein [Rhizobium ruizarguesonis]|uniref:hypothetical protein n=1 Tax=Rhizobium ruizarguesonis TaxID=2081791 RepID=UPI00102F558C|nr:hypothetical protein [Rhizobium ruizarguesonis]TBA59230.1 hypothetical protein ELH59_14990 [Rhizobium ruizarguesonis]
MNRYMIYIPDDGAWMEAVVNLMKLGKAQTDEKHLVTLASEADMAAIDQTLKDTKVHYVLTKLDGEVTWSVAGKTYSAIHNINH